LLSKIAEYVCAHLRKYTYDNYFLIEPREDRKTDHIVIQVCNFHGTHFFLSFLFYWTNIPFIQYQDTGKTLMTNKRTTCTQSKIFTHAFYKQVEIRKRFTWYSSNGLTHLGLQASSRYFFGSTGSSSALNLIETEQMHVKHLSKYKCNVV
jgi:hypothetical protein